MFREFVLVLALAAVALGHSLEKRGAGCRRMMRCLRGVDMTQFTEIEERATDAEALDQICSGMDDITQCIVESQGEQCRDITANEEVRAILRVGSYICSEEGRQRVLSLADSPCSTDEIKELELQVALQGCMEEFQTEAFNFIMNAKRNQEHISQSDMCPFVDNLKACMTRESTDTCGADFGDFISTIWDIAAGQQFAAMGCSSDMNTYVTQYRRMVTRAIPMVLKRSAFLASRRR